MFINHCNSLCTEEITFVDGHLNFPQYIHQVTDGGLAVAKGIKTLPAVLIDRLLKQGGFNSLPSREAISNIPSNHRKGLILASGGCVWTGYGAKVDKNDIPYPILKVLPMGMTQIYAGYLANTLGKFTYISTDASSCVSGHAALYQASLLLKADELDTVVIVSVDNATSVEFQNFFGEQKLIRLANEENDPDLKFRLGQGANITIVSKDATNSIAELKAVSFIKEDYTNPLGISLDGNGYTTVIQQTLDKAGMSHKELHFVKAHATFSSDNVIEEMVIKKLLGNLPIITYKQRIGHTMGASTAVEMGLALQEETGTFISLGAGMGNAFTAALVEIHE